MMIHYKHEVETMSGDGMHSDVVEEQISCSSTPSGPFNGIIARLKSDNQRTSGNNNIWRGIDMSRHC